MATLAEALIAAIDGADLPALRRLLAEPGAQGACDDEGVSIAFRAAEANQLAAVTAFLDAGFPVNAVDDACGDTLIAAADAPDIVRLLLARGADPDARSRRDEGDTPLTGACGSGGLDPVPAKIRALLAAGADPDRPRADGWTPLMLVAAAGHADAASWLLDAGAVVDAAKPDGTRAIDVADHHGHGAVVALLAARGAIDPAAACAARLRAGWATIGAWYEAHAPACAVRWRAARGATAAELTALEATLGRALHYEQRALLSLFGGEGRVPVFEYELLSAARIGERWRGLEGLRARGVFTAEPRELDPARRRVRWAWWHPGWIPFAEDGAGHLWCVDMDPEAAGAVGQILEWEVHAGPVGPRAASLEAFLAAYRDQITSGRYIYDADNGTFDETPQ